MNVERISDDIRRDGIATWPGFVGPDKLGILTTAVDDLLRSRHALQFPKSTRIWDLYQHGAPFVDLLERTDLAAALNALLGEHHLLSDCSLNVVNPRQPQDDWHIDYPYNEMPHLVNGALLGLQCILTLSPFTAENGATQVIPGSHEPPRRPAADTNDPHRTCESPPGTLIILAASTWHRSGYNNTDKPRAAILLSFIERWIRPMTDTPPHGAWSTTPRVRTLLGQQRPPETINGVPI